MEQSKCRVRYVSNAGLVLECGGQSLGVDIFSQDPYGLYPDTPADIVGELLEEIEAGNLKTLIFTHGHGDHFEKKLVVEAWKRNQNLCIVSTEQVIAELERAGLPQGQRIDAWKVKWLPAGLWSIPDGQKNGRERWISFGNSHIGFLNTLHEGARYAEEQNLTLLVDAEGQHMVIPGDAAAREGFFRKVGEWSPMLDWFFLPFPYVGVRSSRTLLVETLKIRNAFVLHQPRPDQDAQNWVENAKRMCKNAHDGLVSPIFPEKLGEWWELQQGEIR